MKKIFLIGCLTASTVALFANEFDKGLELINNGFYLEGHRIMVKYCNEGNALGCAIAGSMYREGLGVNKDYNQAKTFSKKACDGGNAEDARIWETCTITDWSEKKALWYLKIFMRRLVIWGHLADVII